MATLITHYASHEIALKQSGNTLIVKPGKRNPFIHSMPKGDLSGHFDINFPATLQNLAL
jgi:hypothetical protein